MRIECDEIMIGCSLELMSSVIYYQLTLIPANIFCFPWGFELAELNCTSIM